MTQPPAGWYPQDGQERWWDGNAWSDHHRPLSGGYVAPPPLPKSNLARNLLLVFAVIFLLFVGGCVALVAVVGNEVNQVINDDTPGGPNNPLTITEGQGFDVAGFTYADGWTIARGQVTGLLEVDGLKVTNNRDSADRLAVRISLLQDGEVLATAFCTAGESLDKIPRDTTIAVDCSSSDDLPVSYDQVTIQDSF